MISEGSCDTEDWSNDAENFALIIIIIIHYIYKAPYIWKEESPQSPPMCSIHLDGATAAIFLPAYYCSYCILIMQPWWALTPKTDPKLLNSRVYFIKTPILRPVHTKNDNCNDKDIVLKIRVHTTTVTITIKTLAANQNPSCFKELEHLKQQKT